MIAAVDSDEELAVVVRLTRYDGISPAEHLLALMRAYRSVDEADAEAAV